MCEHLRAVFAHALPDAEGKIWHRHPVWFIGGNPIVGYHRLKDGVRVLFWSGQSFPTPGLIPTGSFQAAEFWPTSLEHIDSSDLMSWLRDSQTVQWDYEHIQKNRGLVKRTSF